MSVTTRTRRLGQQLTLRPSVVAMLGREPNDVPSTSLVGAACKTRDPELFFEPTLEQEAVAVCARYCPVRAACAELALSLNVEHGVWGGLTELDRRVLRYPKHRVRCPHCRSEV